MKLRSICSALVIVGAAFAAAEPHNWHLSSNYTFSIDPAWGPVTVTNIVTKMGGASVDNSYGWGSSTWPLTSNNSPHEMTFDTDWFNLEAAEPVLEGSFFLGIVKGLPNDGTPDQKHAVLFMDALAASRIDHIAWGTIFTTTLEDQLIASLEDATNGPDKATVDAGFKVVDDFMDNKAKNANVGPMGTIGSAWFGANADFSIVAFSDAQIIGSGTSSYTTTYAPKPVPEPATVAALGMGALAVLRRRRRS